MAAVNDAQKKTTTHDLDVKVINGMNVYVDHNGNVVRTEKRKNKVKLFSAASKRVENLPPQNDNTLTPEQIMALQKQNS